jgi:hypothetical protein
MLRNIKDDNYPWWIPPYKSIKNEDRTFIQALLG